MDSIFTLSKEEQKKRELDSIDLDDLVEQAMKKCQLNENLELLLYDIMDAIKENQVLLIEASADREDAYLIPLILTYQKTSFFNSFVIATASPKTRNRIEGKIRLISSLLQVDIPIRKLEDNENYVCLRKLHSYNKKRRDSIPNKPLPTSKDVSKTIWNEIHVKHCILGDCKFFKGCKYALDYHDFTKGCLIVPQTTLIGNRRYLPKMDIFKDTNLVIIDEASKLATSITKDYQHQIDYQHLSHYFLRTNQLLFREDTSHLQDHYLQSLHSFFKLLSEYRGTKHWKPTETFQQIAKELAESTRNFHIQLTRRFSFQKMDRNVEYLCEALFSAQQVFEDIAYNSKKFHYRVQNKNSQSDTPPTFMEVALRYTPKMVDDIIKSSLKKIDSSIVFTDSDIAINDYRTLCKDCGIEEMGKETQKEVVKEYVFKK